ncbi:hypothetical protein ACROYT_G042490 [Oculina patagonica]
MAANSEGESLARLFELQDKERLSEFELQVSGGTRHKGRMSSALSVLNKFRLEGEAGFCDLILEVEGRQLTTHRCILAANSQFFYTMFRSGMKESNQKLLSLQSVCFTAMSLILDYFYTREIVINDENVLDLLNASSFLLVTPVKNACIQFVYRRLSYDNCFSVLQIVEQFGADELAEKATNYIKTNFSHVVNSEEFVSISQKELVRFISKDDILVEKEEEVYQSVLKWVKHDEANRVAALPKLLMHLRKDSLPKGFLESELTKEPVLMMASSHGEPVSKETKDSKRAKVSQKAENEKPVLELRPSTEICNVMIGVGNRTPRKHFFMIWTRKKGFLSLRDQKSLASAMMQIRGRLKWETKTYFSEFRVDASLVSLNGLLYYIGGCHYESGSCRDTVECYNPEMKEWSFCAVLNMPRCRSGCVVSEQNIYVIGGGTKLDFYAKPILSSVEKYDPERNYWTYVADLKEARSLPGCVYLGGKIYVIGGFSSYGVIMYNCEVYSPMTDEWQTIARLPHPYCRIDSDVIIVENQITVPFRADETDFSCEALQYNRQSNEWLKVKNLGPSGKKESFTLCTMKLPGFILQKIAGDREALSS